MFGLSLLIVDDDIDTRETFRSLLIGNPNISEIHLLGDEQTDFADLQKIQVDCLLLSETLATQFDVEILETIHRSEGCCPVVMLVGDATPSPSGNIRLSNCIVKNKATSDGLYYGIARAVEAGMLQRTIRDMQQQQELFLRVLVHDLKTPLRHARVLVDMILHDIGDDIDEEAKEHLSRLDGTVIAMKEFVETLSCFATLESEISLKPTSLETVAQKVLESLTGQISERGAEITHDALPLVAAHAAQIQLLFQNLIGNALKYSDKQHPRLHISVAEEDGSFVTLKFEDNGIGIAPKYHSEIFKPFRRLWARDKFSGTGLGLTICEKVAQSHNGAIWCDSAEGDGARFYVNLLKSA